MRFVGGVGGKEEERSSDHGEGSECGPRRFGSLGGNQRRQSPFPVAEEDLPPGGGSNKPSYCRRCRLVMVSR